MPSDYPLYEQARNSIDRYLVKGRATKADVFLCRIRGQRFVVKDFAQKGFWERQIVGRFVIGREAAAYRALAGLPGLPTRFERLSPFSFAVEFIDGNNFGTAGRDELGESEVSQFGRIVDSIHERGWVHLDLHRRSNILLSNGTVYVIDLASALHTGLLPGIGRVFTFLIGIADLLSVIKMKTIYCPEALTARERMWLRIRNAMMRSKW